MRGSWWTLVRAGLAGIGWLLRWVSARGSLPRSGLARLSGYAGLTGGGRACMSARDDVVGVCVDSGLLLRRGIKSVRGTACRVLGCQLLEVEVETLSAEPVVEVEENRNQHRHIRHDERDE